MPIDWRASPNHNARATGAPIDILLLHYTGMKDAGAALSWLCSPRSQVSAHYLICEDGRIVHMVDEARRAWHAGCAFWDGETDINSRSIGIELANPGLEFGYRAFPDAQIEALISLAGDLVARHPIMAQRVLAHSDVAPARKDDPGVLFPWHTLHAVGLGHWVPPVGEPGPPGAEVLDAAGLINRFRTYGYGIGRQGEYHAELADVVTAFQRHFRPARVDGYTDAATLQTLDRLLEALP
ncbi:MAG: N-acetylmuramoyl-L-alanine amidase [Alphaproteobacteria bacterium]